MSSYIPQLIALVNREHITHEVVNVSCKSNSLTLVLAVDCLNQIMDIFPASCSTVINNNGIQAFSQRITNNEWGFMDLPETCI
jgi:hypothetical protein